MRSLFTLIPALILLLAAPAGSEESADTLRSRLEGHVRTLAGEDMRGRGAWEDREKAAAHIAKQFEAIGLEHAPGRKSFFVDQDGKEGEEKTRNVVAWLDPGASTGEGEALPEYVILSAHYDHLGVRKDAVYPGADDNASGVAVLIEAARSLVATDWDEAPARAILFVAFDLEEKSLAGSRRFAADPPLPLDRCAAFLTMDQMGRSLADLTPGMLFLMGAEHSEAMTTILGQLEPPEGGRKARLGIDFQPPTGYSDYVPFLEKKIPFLFVTSGACAHYHQPGDIPDLVDFPRLEANADFVLALLERLARADERPIWRDGDPEASLEEIELVRDIVAKAQEKIAGMPDLQGPIPIMVANFRKYLDGIIESGKVTDTQRTSVRNTARILFQQAVTALR